MPAETETLPPPSRPTPILGADVDRGRAFLPWLDHLPEVGDRLRKMRARALDTAAEAAALELHAARLRRHVDEERAAILKSVDSLWSPADVARAVEAAELRSVTYRQLRAVPDAAMASAMESLDGTHLASEALAAFAAVRVPGDDAPEAEVREALARVRAWLDLAASPVLARLNAGLRGLERSAARL